MMENLFADIEKVNIHNIIDKLDLKEKVIVNWLYLYPSSMDISDLVELNDIELSYQEIANILDQLSQYKLASFSGKYIILNHELKEYITKIICSDEEILQFRKLNTYHAIEDIRYLFYTNQFDKIKKIKTQKNNSQPVGIEMITYIYQITISDFVSEWFDKLDHQFKLLICQHCLTEDFLSLHENAISKISYEFLKTTAKFSSAAESNFSLFRYLRLSDSAPIEKLDTEDNDLKKLTLATFLFFRGDFKESRILFDELSNTEGLYLAYSHSIQGLCMLLSFLQKNSNLDKFKNLSQSYIHTHPQGPLVSEFTKILLELQNQNDFWNEDVYIKITKATNNLFFKIALTAIFFSQEIEVTPTFKVSKSIHWKWLDNQHKKIIKKDFSSDFLKFNSISTFDRSWKEKLNLLSTISQDNYKMTSKNIRIIWLLDPKNFELIPKKQTKIGSKWSKGKELSLNFLLENLEIKNSFTEEDQIIVDNIYQKYDSWNYKSELKIRNYKALYEASDHPHIYWKGNELAPITIRKSKPYLEVLENRDSIKISMVPEFTGEKDYLIQKKSDYEIEVLKINKSLEKIQTIIGSSLVLPASEKETVEDLIENLGNYINIHRGNISNNDIEISNPDNYKVNQDICIHIQRSGSLFQFICYIEPLDGHNILLVPGQGYAHITTQYQNKKIQFNRNLDEEAEKLLSIKNILPILVDSKSHTWITEDIDTTLNVLSQLKKNAPQVILKWRRGDSLHISEDIGIQNFRINLSRNNDWLNINGKIKLNDQTEIEMFEFLKIINEKNQSFIQIDDRNFIKITNELKKNLLAIEKLTTQGNFHISQSQALNLHIDQTLIANSRDWKNHIKYIDRIKSFTPTISDQFVGNLRSYQKNGVHWIQRLLKLGVGACLADDMGLGKTVQAAAIIAEQVSNGPCLIISPTSVCFNWKEELKKFCPNAAVTKITSSKQIDLISDQNHVYILSYGLLNACLSKILDINWNLLILDEAQSVKNANTRRFKNVVQIKSQHKIILTGTPIENSLHELWALFKIINPGLFPSRKQFEQKFAGPIEMDGCMETSQMLKDLIKPYILRRTKKEVLKELPKKTEIIVKLDLFPDEYRFYESLRNESIKLLGKNEFEGDRNKLQILGEITKLRLAASNPRLLDEKISMKSSKLSALKNIIQDVIGNRRSALVFSQFVKHLNIVREYLDSESIAYQYLDGSTPSDLRQSIVSRFQTGIDPLFLISLKAGGFGLNLTKADVVIHLDPWWNPSVENQATDRAYRIGQNNPVTVYKLISKDTIEEKIHNLHSSKLKLFESHVPEGEDTAKLTTKDLIEIIRN